MKVVFLMTHRIDGRRYRPGFIADIEDEKAKDLIAQSIAAKPEPNNE